MGTLLLGANLDLLRRQLTRETADLPRRRPPFHSPQNANVFFHATGATELER
jgi:hypothetical protein